MNGNDPAIDWNAVGQQATELLADYIRINTTNPPGGEEAGAIFLREALAREGIDSTLYDAGDGRVSLSARIAARSSSPRKPIVLLSHIDVVPVEEEHWDVAPFSGEIRDGILWGRGTLDMKGMGIMELLTLALAKRHGLEFERDLVMVAVADEEEGGLRGMHYLRDNHPEVMAADYVFNEGAYGFSEFMGKQAKIFGLGPSEKSPCWITLSTEGTPGHGSVPHGNNALARLVKAVAKIDSHERRAVLTPAVEGMIRTLTQKGFVPTDLDPHDEETLQAIGTLDAHLHAITHDTVSLTGMHSGHKHNVIPARAVATLDCRLLPTTSADEFVREMTELIDDPAVKITRKYQHESGQSSMDTPVASIAAQVVREKMGEDAFIMPVLSPGFTDSHAYRHAGAEAYGFTPCLLTSADLAGIHGHNERISLDNIKLGTEVLFEVVRRLATAH